MNTGDTIAAIATAAGAAGVGIVRISGPEALAIGVRLAGAAPAPRHMALRWFQVDQDTPLDRGLFVQFPAPHSYTGEDMVELHGHGGTVVMQTLLAGALAAGARQARPGEFTERAFLNGKLDLAQAEAVADLIGSRTEQAARAATRSLSGAFSEAVGELHEALVHLRLHVEAAIDFPDEDIDFLDAPALRREVDEVRAAFVDLDARVAAGRTLQEGLEVVLIGAPNVGKSSLMNALAGDDAAIVTPVAGTTRDLIRTPVSFDGVPVQLTDTAGLHDSDDEIEREGMRRSRAALAKADHALLMADASAPTAVATLKALAGELPAGLTRTVVVNKMDIAAVPVPDYAAALECASVSLSALTGTGLGDLQHHIVAHAIGQTDLEGSLSARTRHVRLLARAREHFEAGVVQLEAFKAGELLAEELALAQAALNDITGTFTADDLLGKIFGEFCIGK
ncbi:MAG: tRNA uridine-5-carboxymethylaminomethyl(34) synthesis GTPase MnmE [Pseudomonadota bacterium]